MSRPLPRYREDPEPRKIDKLIEEADYLEPPTTQTKATLPGDTRRLRGIPVIGGITGTSPGTDPWLALQAKERARRFKARRFNRS